MTLLWLDDKLETISYEVELIREYNTEIDIHTFTKIDELLDYLETENIDKKERLFIIDVMLINEDTIKFKDTNVAILEELMAGVTLYQECLDKYFPDINTILYTSRGGENQGIFQQIKDDERYDESLFLIGKEELDTEFKDILGTLGIKIW